jgi:hypothetical protein
LSRGLYVQARPRTLAQTLHAWQQVLPATAAFSHLTAAELRGWWLPGPIPHPIFVASLHQLSRPRRPGLLVCRHPEPFGINLVDSLRVTTAAETILAAARDLGVLDLVILGDSALRLKHCTVTELRIVAAQRRRGAPLLRTVIPLLDARSESAWESIMRVLHVAAEIPVTPQYEIFDDRGRFIARADLRIRGTRRIHEYDGEMHREPEVQDVDLIRDRRLMADQWQRHGFTARHLLRDGMAIIADADRLLERPWDPRRLHAWQQLISQSLLGRQGRARAYQHWRRAEHGMGQMLHQSQAENCNN